MDRRLRGDPEAVGDLEVRDAAAILRRVGQYLRCPAQANRLRAGRTCRDSKGFPSAEARPVEAVGGAAVGGVEEAEGERGG